MTANEIYLRLKSIFTDTALPKIRKFVGAVGSQMSKAGQAVAGVTAMFGEMQGAMGKAVSAAGRVCTALMALGPIGGVIAGVSAIIDALSASAVKTANEIRAAAQRFAESARASIERARNAVRDILQKTLEESTVKAKRATQAFDDLAAAYMKIAKAKDATAEAGDAAEIAALRRQKAEAIASAGSKTDEAMTGAEFDVKIAERAAKATADAQNRAVAQAEADAKNAASRRTYLELEEVKAQQALADVKFREQWMKEQPSDGSEDSALRELRQHRERVEAALLNAQRARAAAETDALVASEKLKQAQLAQAAALADSAAAVAAAKKSLANLEQARDKAAKAELDAAEKAAMKAAHDAERKALNQEAGFHRRFIQGEQARVAESAEKLRAAENAKASAWAMYKSPEAMRAQLQEEKNEARARRRFEADAERLQRRSDWRTARLGRRDEATRRMLLAKEEADVRKKELDGMRRQVADSKRALEKIAATLEQEVAL